MKNTITIVILLRKPYPCKHGLLEALYTDLLPEKGYDVIWIMPAAIYSENRPWSLQKWNNSRVYTYQDDQGAGKIGNLYKRAFFQRKILTHITRIEKLDIIQVRNDWMAGLIGSRVAHQMKIPLVYQISFPTPERLMYADFKRKVLGIIWKRVEKKLSQEATLILPISLWMKEKLVSEGISPEKMMVLPLGADTRISPDRVGSKSAPGSLIEKPNPSIIYFGDMGKLRNLDFLLRVFRIVLDSKPTTKLWMVGGSKRAQDLLFLKEYACQIGINHSVFFTGDVARNDLLNYIACADIGVSPIVPLPIYQISSPAKLVETMCMAKPVVGNDIPEQKTILEESGGGICVKYNETDFANAIIYLLENPSIALQMGRKGRTYIENNRSYEILADNLDKAYRNLTYQVEK